jgi:hypothetical protein
MFRVCRPAAAAVLSALVAAGCGGREKPNPDLKVPDVPAGDRGAKGAPVKEQKPR